MSAGLTFAESVLQFIAGLACRQPDVPAGFRMLNPFSGEQREQVTKVASVFYQTYYNDTHERRIILGSSPARLGSAVTGIPFEDAAFLQDATGIRTDRRCGNRASSDFLLDVIRQYGGRRKFYAAFYMNFVCPLGIASIHASGREQNCNYYENKILQQALLPFILCSLQEQISFGVDTSVCYCIGSGENYRFLSRLNADYGFFKTIVPLPHPRFVMQYNARRKSEFMEIYLSALRHA